MENCSKNTHFFEEKVTKHYDYLRKFLMTATKDHTLASDLTQETMTTAWEKVHLLRYYSDIKHALLRMAKNKLCDYLKKNKPHKTISSPEVCHRPVSEEDGLLRLIKSEERRTILAAIGNLSEEHIQVILLRYYYGQSLRDVAEMTNTNYNTVLSRHRRALKALEESLEKRMEK